MFSAHHSGESAINTRRTAALAAAVVLGALSLPSTAIAAPTDLYVNNTDPSRCSDSGTGTLSTPYCTVSAAAAQVLPGQTVHITGGYQEQVDLTRSGTASAPITFTGEPVAPGGQNGGIGNHRNSGPVQAVYLHGASHVRIRDLWLSGLGHAVTVDGGSDIAITHNTMDPNQGYGDGDSVVVSGPADGVTISRNTGRLVRLGPGVKGAVVATNQLDGVRAESAPGTVVVSNTIATTTVGISLTGTSTGATVENNVVDTARPGYAVPDRAVEVAAEAVPGTKLAYNSYAAGTVPAYRWAGQTYTTVSAFAAATGQGSHDLIGNVTTPARGSAADATSAIIDSADENAPGMTDRDLLGNLPVDDPYVPNTGTGSGVRDRGAYEITEFAARYTPVGPLRVLDTRNGTGTKAVAVPPGGTVNLQVSGVNGLPATGLTAVTMNVTVTQPTGPGFLTVHPHGADRPTASNLNWTAGETIPNLVTTKVTDGKVSFYNGSPGTVHVVADLLGYYGITGGSGYHTATPTRLLDTRTTGQTLTPGRPLDLQITGRNGVPATGVTAVTLNVTVTKPTDRGFLTVYPHGTKQPTASNLNWTAGETIPNLVTVPVKDGKVTLVTGGTNGTAQVVADLAGYFTATGGDSFYAQTPYRALDTRIKPAGAPDPTLRPGGTASIQSRTPGATLSMNVTATGGTAPGFLTVHPGGTALPLASNLNWTAGETIPNQVVVDSGSTEQPVIHNGSSGTVDVIADVFGYYLP